MNCRGSFNKYFAKVNPISMFLLLWKCMVYTGVMFFQDKIYEKQFINMAELWHSMGGGWIIRKMLQLWWAVNVRKFSIILTFTVILQSWWGKVGSGVGRECNPRGREEGQGRPDSPAQGCLKTRCRIQYFLKQIYQSCHKMSNLSRNQHRIHASILWIF